MPTKQYAAFIANKVNHLFNTQIKSNGRPYSQVEVERQTLKAARSGKIPIHISSSDISRMRNGDVTNPSFVKLQALAHFFDISISYFQQDGMELKDNPETLLQNIAYRSSTLNLAVDDLTALSGIFEEIAKVRAQYSNDSDDTI
ncbi:MAG: hypothetical protein ACPG8W_03260 [Candidatus Promineifilaceae bacterium]